MTSMNKNYKYIFLAEGRENNE